ncbi:hypothetical protein [Bacillus ndiopicus]|uniref:hypothetical protein n=1 Tax=Bacillus ndiopicus TaxID=1347368 RepID=UPI0005A9577F|nr:hypothetical protein [Bacillus ndiopicus]
MFTVGVIGSATSVHKVISLAQNLKLKARFIALPYTNFQETKLIIQSHDHEVDFWFPTGQLPYAIAKEVLQTDDFLIPIQNNEASLYKAFLEVAYHSNIFLQRLSIDEMSKQVVDDALIQLNIESSNIYLKIYDTTTTSEELINFHKTLWAEDKTYGAITSFEAVYNELQQLGIPVYWYSISHSEILHACKVLEEKIKTSFFKDTQIGVCTIAIEEISTTIVTANPYAQQYLALQIKEILINLSEHIDGFLTEQGDNRYIIFSTRGAIEKNYPIVRQKIQELKLLADKYIITGIGYGETALAAEVNATIANQHSRNNEQHEIFVMQEDGTIIEHIGHDKELVYTNKLFDTPSIEALKEANISMRTYNRIQALLLKLGTEHFTTLDLTNHLQMENRNARRIVTNLSKAGLIEYVGESTHHVKGRPRKIYRFLQQK